MRKPRSIVVIWWPAKMRNKSLVYLSIFLILFGSCSSQVNLERQVSNTTSSTQTCFDLIGDLLSSVGLPRYYADKIRELKHVDESNIYAVILRLKLMTQNRGIEKKFISVEDLRPIHPITYEKSLRKTRERAKSVRAFLEREGKRSLSVETQMQLLPSKNPMRAVKDHEGKYIIFDGNGRFFAYKEALDLMQEKGFKLEVEVFDMPPGSIEHLLELRGSKTFLINPEFADEMRYSLARLDIDIERFDSDLKKLAEELNYLIKHHELTGGSSPYSDKIYKLRKLVRTLEVTNLWRTRGLGDVISQGFTVEELRKMFKKKKPLGISKEDWDKIRDELGDTLGRDKLVELKGMTTTFYSTRPSDSLGSHLGARKKIELYIYDDVLNREYRREVRSAGPKKAIWNHYPRLARLQESYSEKGIDISYHFKKYQPDMFDQDRYYVFGSKQKEAATP
jgi:hypothetical protein